MYQYKPENTPNVNIFTRILEEASINVKIVNNTKINKIDTMQSKTNLIF